MSDNISAATTCTCHEDANLKFPRDFLWGVATSPTQIEGSIVNEWADFKARDLSTPNTCADQWQNPGSDLALLSRLNLSAYRMGLDWGRLQAGPCTPLAKDVVIRYGELIEQVKERGIEPFVTLFHFACPVWMAQRGGWTSPESVDWFCDFVHRVCEARLPIKYWISINEPGVYVTMAYLLGMFPLPWPDCH